jgi:hypothetical protein
MNEKEELPFLSRWSRRKLDAKEEIPPPLPAEPGSAPDRADADASAAPAAPAVGTPAPAPLPSIDSLQGVASEYRDFLKPGVDETLKRAALKKLFNDPHFSFASMDKLDTYIDDYSIEDPIPEAMLRMLNQSKSLFLFEEKKGEGESGGEQVLPPGDVAQPEAIAAPDGGEVGNPAQGPAQVEAQTTGAAAEKKTEPPVAS